MFLGGASYTGRPPTKSEDCDKLCPIHRKPHPLCKCHVFQEKAIEECKQMILKENNVCFKCCSSTSHVAKNCKTKVQCSECKIEKHYIALLPGPAPWIKKVDPLLEHGGEEEEPQPQPEVRGDQSSCSKICLVKGNPTDQRHIAIKLYTILDEQSNQSLVR